MPILLQYRMHISYFLSNFSAKRQSSLYLQVSVCNQCLGNVGICTILPSSATKATALLVALFSGMAVAAYAHSSKSDERNPDDGDEIFDSRCTGWDSQLWGFIQCRPWWLLEPSQEIAAAAPGVEQGVVRGAFAVTAEEVQLM